MPLCQYAICILLLGKVGKRFPFMKYWLYSSCSPEAARDQSCLSNCPISCAVFSQPLIVLIATYCQIWNSALACNCSSRKIRLRLWKKMWKSSKLWCGSQFYEGFSQKGIILSNIKHFLHTALKT